MNDLLKKVKMNSRLTALLYAALGAVLLIWPELSAGILSIAMGAVLVVCGAVNLVVFLRSRNSSLSSGSHLLAGIVLIAVGIWIMTQPALVSVVVPRIIGALICVHGAADLGHAVTLRRSGYSRWAAALVLGLLTLAAGAVLLCDPFDVYRTVVRMIGLCLLYDGISDLWIVSRVSKALRQSKKDAETEAGAVDAEYRDVPPDTEA